jgi:uncharacterized linocin/CFP29 family protein
MNHLLRGHAPITDIGWKLIDEEAQERLEPGLAARRVVDFNGPLGWEQSATSLGRAEPPLPKASNGLEASKRTVLPFVELRAPFSVDRAELSQGDRGAEDVDFADLDRAAQVIVNAENGAIFHGLKGSFEGMTEASSHKPLKHKGDPTALPNLIATGVDALMRIGIAGPFALVLGHDAWTYVEGAAEEGGWPLRRHLREILDGPLIWAPGVEGAVLASLRGGDFLFDCGQDIAVGYRSHDPDSVELYLELSFSFRVVTPEAAIAVEISG